MLPASIAPSALPAPTMVCNSSMKTMLLPSSCASSFSTAFRRSSNSPRNLAPASSAARSSDSTRLPRSALGHFVVDDALRQAFDDGGLADAGFADQHGIVLGAALQDLDGAADLVVATDHRIELALAGTLGQVHRVLGQGLAVGLALCGGHRLAAAHGVDGGFQRLLLQAGFLQDAAGRAFVVGQRQQEQLAGDVGVAPARGFLVGARQHALQLAADLDVVIALHLRQGLERLLDGRLQPVHGDAGARQQAAGPAVGIGQQRGQHMYGLNVGMIVAGGQALGVRQCLLELGGKFVESHSGRLAC